MRTKTKAAGLVTRTASRTTDSQNLTARAHRITMVAAIKRRIWLIGYDLEETRQLHATSGRFWKQAGVCITLALLRMGRLF